MQSMNSQPDPLEHPPAAVAPAPRQRAGAAEHVGVLLLVCAFMVAACLFGVWTRLAGQLAVFWPANALLLGLFLRFPRADTAAGWIGAALGHLVAGHIAGDALPASVLLTLSNFASVVPGYLLLMQPIHRDARQLHGLHGVLQLIGCVGLASIAGGMAGSVVGPLVFNNSVGDATFQWFVSELVNYISILPAVLAIPTGSRHAVARQWRGPDRHMDQLAPLLALLLSAAAGVLVGGPGAMAFPLPALLWCAMRYGMFGTAVLTLLSTTWTLLAISKGIIDAAIPIETPAVLMSVRLGVSLIALSPIAVASAMVANRSLMARLLHMAEHDPMTGTMNRRAFSEHAGAALRQAQQRGEAAALLVLDIDRFKSVNDTHGHATGDQVIQHVAETLRRLLPQDRPLLGRLGGEEFALLLTGCDQRQAEQFAERVRADCARAQLTLDDGALLGVTVSIGVCFSPAAGSSLSRMLQSADRALYEAKHAGRNRVALATRD
jgi:diguanylate cyclase (GGDEF)-like protein